MKATENIYGNVYTTDVGGGGSDGNRNIPVEDCWYNGQEWKVLGEKGCAATVNIRAGRKGPKKPAHQGKKFFTKQKATERKVAAIEKKVKNQMRHLADISSSTSASDSNKSSEEEEETINDSGSNRNHGAVTRQVQGRRKKKRT